MVLLAVWGAPARGQAETRLLHRYSFTADASDSVGGQHGALLGGAVISNGQVVLNGTGAYVDLPNGILSGLDSVTLEVWLTDNNSGNWSRIFDFGNSSGGEDVAGTGTRYVFLSPQAGNGSLRGAITITGGGAGEQVLEWSGVRLPANTLKHVAWTADGATHTGRLYVDGLLVAENSNMTLRPSDLGITSNNWIGRSQFSADAYLRASITEFRIYDGALTTAEVQESAAEGPDSSGFAGPVAISSHPQSQAVTELLPVTFSVSVRGARPILAQWFRNQTPIPNATNTTLTLPSATLADNGANYRVALTNTVTNMTFSVVSSNALLSVRADTNPPALLRAESLYPTEVRVSFSEGLRADTALNAANYVITSSAGSLPVSAARFGETAATVILTTAPQSLGTNYTLTVNGVRDLAAAANPIAANSQTHFIATPFVATDIGHPAAGGVMTVVGNGFDLTSSGAALGGTQDECTFAHQRYTNDFDVQVRVATLGFASAWTRAGLMARDGLVTNAVFAAAVATPGPAGCHFLSRAATGASATLSGLFPVNYPDTWLRLRRSGNVFSGFASLDGQTWEFLGSATLAVSATVEVGFAASAGAPGAATSVQFRDFNPGAGLVVTNLSLPFEPPGPCSRRTPLVITEIMYNPPDAWDATNNLEFVELWNSGLVTEDLTGHQLTGEISYRFPDHTRLAPGQFLVVAKDPAAAQRFYGVTCLGPYTNKLSNSGGVLRLLNELGGRLLEIEYDNRPPWPAAPDGAGHSLVLSRPSFGEKDPRAWSASPAIGGSPGAFDHYQSEPADQVVINEFLAHTDEPQEDYIELFNTGIQAVNVSGMWLSDTAATNKFRIPDGTTIPARGFLAFTQTQLGFSLSADGEKILLVNSNRTRVIDAVAFDGQANGVSAGRHPDGAPGFQPLASVTPGTANQRPRVPDVVINEIMYHPISESDDDEYVEIYNRSGQAVSLANWRLQGGVSFTFPPHAVIPAGGYVVVGKNLARLLEHYTQLNLTNAWGNYSGSLRNRGERIALARPEDLVSTNSQGVVTTNLYFIVEDEVAYLDGGRWGKWSDGGGSSLELKDPDADNRLAANWADSDESNKAPWTPIDVTRVMENGMVYNDESRSATTLGTANRFEVFLQGPGEALLDNVEFHSNGGANLLANGTFDAGATGWTLGGVLRGSFVEAGVGLGGTPALHLAATARGDTGPNKIAAALTATAATGAPNTGRIVAWARWLRGSPHILLRIRGNWMEVSQRLNLPANLGTPGLPNSRRVGNAGPALVEVTHTPVLPAVGQPVRVSARAIDPDGIGSVTLRYRLDPGTTFTPLAMLDNGTGGDAVAGDGIYSATLPGLGSGALVAFQVHATDSLGATARFPEPEPGRECLVRWGESPVAGTLGSYRLWLTSSNVTFWTNREKNANDPVDATFVYGNFRAFYNVDTLYSGSPFHVPNYNGPVGSMACDYEVNFAPDEPFLGSQPFVLTAYDVVSGNFFFNDDSGQVDLTGTWIGRQLGQPYNYRRHVHVFVNGLRRGTIYDDAQQPNREMLDEYFPEDERGQLRKIESWFEFADDALTQASTYATLTRVNRSSGEIDTGRYRWNWRPRATANPDDWSALTNLIAVVNDTLAPDYEGRVRTWMDVANFLRPVAVHHICGSWDSYAYDRGKNMYAYKPDTEPWRLLMWDIELALGAGGNAPSDSIYRMFDQTLLRMITNTPSFHREYLRAFQEALDSPLQPGAADPLLDERYASFLQNNVPMVSPQFIKNFIAARRNYLLTVIPSATFSVNNPAYQAVSGTNLLTLTGSAPLSVEHIFVNGIPYPVTWTGTTTWRVLAPLAAGTNFLTVTATDRKGNAIPNASFNLTANYTGAAVAPEGHVVFSEILPQPVAGGAQFVELFNTHSNFAFDLSGWSINGLAYVFPPGSTIPPRGFRVLCSDPFAFSQTYGLTNVPFGAFDGRLDEDGETLTLLRPGAGTNQIVVDRVRYEAATPWPAATNGISLQLVDPSQDNSRVANWAVRLPTNLPAASPQWVYASTTATLASSASRLYLYLGSAGEIYLDDVALVSGSTPGSGPNLITNGGFETALDGSWSLSADFASSTLSTTVKHSGNSSLRMVATAPGSGGNDSVYQTLGATLPAGGVYSLSFWYLQNTNGTPFIARLQNSTSTSGLYVSLDPRLPIGGPTFIPGATPGQPNNVATNLPPFPPLWLNEVQTWNLNGPLDNFGQREPWAELRHTGATDLGLGGYYLTDSYEQLTKWPFPTNALIPSNGFLVVWCDGAPEQTASNALHTSFRLSADAGCLVLTRALGSGVQIVDYLNYPALPANWSYGDLPDAQPFYRKSMFFATPGATNNGAPAPLAVVINEWLADNSRTLADPADGNFEDWFELYNPGTNAANLGGCYLTDNLTNRFQFRIPDNGHYVIPPGGYLLVWADNEDNQNSTNRSDLHVSFALSKGGEAIGLFASDGTPIDAVTFGPQTTDVSEGRFPDGAAAIHPMPTPTPRAPNLLPNSPPSLAPIPDRFVTLGQTVAFTVSAMDADVPPQMVLFSLANPVPGAHIGPSSGLFTWTPVLAPATNSFTVVVTDSGLPPLTASQTFTVIVVPPPALSYSFAGPNLVFQWNSVPGQLYQVDYKNDLNELEWHTASAVMTGTGGVLSFSASWESAGQRFFRLRLLP